LRPHAFAAALPFFNAEEVERREEVRARFLRFVGAAVAEDFRRLRDVLRGCE